MKNLVISALYLVGLLFAVNVSAAEQKAPDQEQAEGEVEEAKASLNLQEANVDGLFLDTVKTIVGKLLSQGGIPADQATDIGAKAAEAVSKEGAAQMPQ